MSADLRHYRRSIVALFVILRRAVLLIVHLDSFIGMKTASKHASIKMVRNKRVRE